MCPQSYLQRVHQIRDMLIQLVQFPFGRPILHNLQQLVLPWSAKGVTLPNYQAHKDTHRHNHNDTTLDYLTKTEDMK